jgi:putative solute:sodium symporter small subunit
MFRATPQMPDPNSQFHWRRTKALMFMTLGLWFVFAIAVQIFVVPLNLVIVPYLDLPLGFFLTAQGSVIAFVVISFWFARRQDRIDRDHFIVGDGP